MNVPKKYVLFSLLFGFTIVLGFSSADNVSATSSITHSVNITSTPQSIPLCENNDCVDYNYVHIWVSGYTAPSSGYSLLNIVNSGNALITYNIYNVTQSQQQFYFAIPPASSSLTVIKFQGSTINYEYVDNLGAVVPTGTINITSNGSFDVSSYGTAVVNVPNEENSQFMGIVIDSFWQYHVAFASAIVGIIAIFLVYRIIKGRIR